MKKYIVLILVLSFIVFIPASVFAQGMMGWYGNGYNNMMGYVYSPFGFLGLLFMVIFWALVVSAIVLIVKWVFSFSNRKTGEHSSALDILKERYARGEINKEEFEQKKEGLM